MTMPTDNETAVEFLKRTRGNTMNKCGQCGSEFDSNTFHSCRQMPEDRVSDRVKLAAEFCKAAICTYGNQELGIDARETKQLIAIGIEFFNEFERQCESRGIK